MGFTYRWVTAFALSLLLAACTTSPQNYGALPDDPAFPREQALETFASVYATVTKKALADVTVEEIALSSLKGLSKLDNSLDIQDNEQTFSLFLKGERLERFIKPEANKIEEWAETTLATALLARKASISIAQNKPEDIYSNMFVNMLKSVDDYSRYASPMKAQNNRAKRNGYGGIGIIIAEDKATLIIDRVFPHGPADIAGLKKGDLLISVSHSSTKGMKPSDVAQLIRGPIQSKVTLDVLRPNVKNPLSFEITRGKVIRPTVKTTQKEGIVTLKISGFNKNTAYSLTESIKTAFKSHNPSPQGFILDLRSNPGGLLKQSVRITDLFISGGRLVGAKGRHPLANRSYRANSTDIIHGLPLVVVIDGKSASAAEIVAATLQDRGRAVVIGTNSYGKGTVQTINRLPNGGEMTLTWSKLSLPSGSFFHKLGVYPVICTSGAKSQTKGLIENTVTRGDEFAAVINEWRSVGYENLERRQELRGKCPAEKRSGDMELKLATRLIENGLLYETLLILDQQGQALLH